MLPAATFSAWDDSRRRGRAPVRIEITLVSRHFVRQGHALPRRGLWPWPFLRLCCGDLQVPVDNVGHRPVQGAAPGPAQDAGPAGAGQPRQRGAAPRRGRVLDGGRRGHGLPQHRRGRGGRPELGRRQAGAAAARRRSATGGVAAAHWSR